MKTKIMISLIAILLIGNQIQAQITVTGLVTDYNGEALPGTSVLVKGTTVGTVTLGNGTYSIGVPVGSTTLVFSYFAMETLEEKINGRNVIDVSLKPSGEGLEEVVVTALGRRRPIKRLSYAIGNAVNRTKVKTQNVNVINNEPRDNHNTEEYDHISENGYKDTKENPLSTLSINPADIVCDNNSKSFS